MTEPNGRDSGVPEYGTDEYRRWYEQNFGPVRQPAPPAPPVPPAPRRKRHRLRWILAGVGVLVVIVVIGSALASSGGGSGKHLTAAGHKAPAAKASKIPCVNSPSLCPASDPTDHSVQSDAPTDPPSSADAPSFGAIGSTLTYTESNGYDSADDASAEITVTQVGTYSAPISQDEFGSNLRPHEGSYRVFKVTMAVSDGTIDDVDSASFRWESSTGRVFDEGEGNSYESGFNSDDELNPSGGAAAGQTFVGDVIFDVPPGAGKLELVNFDNAIIGGWTVAH